MIRFTEQGPSASDNRGLPNDFAETIAAVVAWLRRSPLFVAVVLAPTVAAAIYYLLIAAPLYVSEARFIVRTPGQQAPSTLDSVLMGVGFGSASSAATDSYTVHEYISSREAVRDLEKYHDLRAVLARPSIDFLGRFPRLFGGQKFEDLYRAYPRYVTVGFNSQTGISTLRVQAFTPQDAANIANALLDGGEGVINKLNRRSEEDAVEDAHLRVKEAEDRVATSETALTDFRNRERLIDPARSSMADLDLVGKLEIQIATLRAQRGALAASAAESPQLPELDQQIAAFQAQADAQKAKIAGQSSSLAPMIGEYERLIIDRDFAAKELTTASAEVESARLEMRRKHLYLERVVSPNVPDAPRGPKRLLSLAMVLGTALLIYGSLKLIIAGFREHAQD